MFGACGAARVVACRAPRLAEYGRALAPPDGCSSTRSDVPQFWRLPPSRVHEQALPVRYACEVPLRHAVAAASPLSRSARCPLGSYAMAILTLAGRTHVLRSTRLRNTYEKHTVYVNAMSAAVTFIACGVWAKNSVG